MFLALLFCNCILHCSKCRSLESVWKLYCEHFILLFSFLPFFVNGFINNNNSSYVIVKTYMKIKERNQTLIYRFLIRKANRKNMKTNSRQSTNESILGLKEPDNEYNRMRANLVSHQRQSFDVGVICSIRTVSEGNCKKNWLVIPSKS